MNSNIEKLYTKKRKTELKLYHIKETIKKLEMEKNLELKCIACGKPMVWNGSHTRYHCETVNCPVVVLEVHERLMPNYVGMVLPHAPPKKINPNLE